MQATGWASGVEKAMPLCSWGVERGGTVPTLHLPLLVTCFSGELDSVLGPNLEPLNCSKPAGLHTSRLRVVGGDRGQEGEGEGLHQARGNEGEMLQCRLLNGSSWCFPAAAPASLRHSV